MRLPSEIDAIAQTLSTHRELACAYLFGSTARGEQRAGSDIDIAVLFGEEPPHLLDGLGLDLQAELERVARRRVDLVVLNRAPVDLVHRILRDGVLLNENDVDARIRFEVVARNRYFDLLPHLRRYRRSVTESVS